MIHTDTLHYTERTNGEYRDLRQIEAKLPKRKFARISINGIHRCPHSHIRATRYGNPGWSFGTENIYINWTHFYRHCFHFSINIFKRGVTFSYGKRIF